MGRLTHQFESIPSHQRSPILCLCYTNHALDQFLIGLIENGIENVVRVGGAVRRKEIEEYDIKKIRKGSHKNDYKYDIDRLGTQLEDLSEGIQRLSR